MGRFPRVVIQGEKANYHIISRSVLDGFPFGDNEKEHLLQDMFMALSRLFFIDILGYCIMGDHFHLVARVYPDDLYDDEEIVKRYEKFYDSDVKLKKKDIKALRIKLSSISEFIKEIKQRFARYYNRENGRKGLFWDSRYKSVIVEDGAPLLECLTYVELNPVRAGIVKRPEAYKWSSLGYRSMQNGKDSFLSYDFGLKGFARKKKKEKYDFYREHIYVSGGLRKRGYSRNDVYYADGDDVDYNFDRAECFMKRNSFFSNSGILGSREYVDRFYREFRHIYVSKRERVPRRVKGMGDIYSLKGVQSLGGDS